MVQYIYYSYYKEEKYFRYCVSTIVCPLPILGRVKVLDFSLEAPLTTLFGSGVQLVSGVYRIVKYLSICFL